MTHRELTPERLKAKLEHRMLVLAHCEEQERLLKERERSLKKQDTLANEIQAYADRKSNKLKQK